MPNNLPEPNTRKETFLASAAGMTVETPTPITREEMYLDAIGKGGGSGDAYTKDETDQLLDGKADLVDGKITASELPAMSIDSLSDTAVDTPENGEVLKYDADQGKWVNGTASGGGGTTDYTDLTNKPKINNITLSGNKTASDLGITEMELGETSSTAYAGNKGKENADAITAIKDGQSIDSFGDVETALADKVDKVSGKGLSTEDYTTAEKTKLSGIAAGAEVNVQSDWNQTDAAADDFIKNKPNIPAGVVVDQVYDGTSTNAQSGVAIAGALSDKVDKVTGKGLSTNDYTTAEKDKLAGIASGAEVNVQSDWSQSDSSADDYIKNKPTIPAAQVNADWNAVSGVAQILNKPTIPTVDQSYGESSTNAQSGTAVASAISGKISATDYATQTTGGTIKAWTTTDGSDTILHLATQ